MENKSSHPDLDSDCFLTAENISAERSRGIGEKEVCLRQVSLEVSRGEILALAGERGAGTSVFCQLLATGRLQGAKILSGKLRVGGENLLDLRPRRRKHAFRSHVLYSGRDLIATYQPKRTVLQNLRDFVASRELPIEVLAASSLHEKLYRVGCIEPETFLSKKVETLTELELARVVLLRVLLSEVELFVCDGVTSGLDPVAENQFFELLVHLQKEENLAIVLTTGRLAGVETFADRVAVFYEGGVLESGEANGIVTQPKFLYTEEFRSCSPRIEDPLQGFGGISREAVAEADEAIHGTVTTLSEDESPGYRRS